MEFADGTIIETSTITVATDRSDALAAQDITGTDNNDTLTGGNFGDTLTGNDGDDVIDGGAGNDTLKGNSGNDTLIGGKGNDRLEGSYGDDTYIWNLGDGFDTIYDYNRGNTDNDTIKFGEGISFEDLSFERDGNSLSYRKDWGAARLYCVYPWAKVYDSATGNTIEEPLSARIAGLIAKTDNDKGFWWSPSNNIINGIIGISKPIDFTLGDPNCVANYLNENLITTVIQQDGFRLWGNRTTSADSKWAFLSVRRTADMINDSLLKAHLWAIDRNITKTYVSDVCDGVSNYLRYLKNIGAIINGSCWADSSLNTPDQISQGKIVFDFDFTPPYPAEHITFRSRLTDEYLTEIFE